MRGFTVICFFGLFAVALAATGRGLYTGRRLYTGRGLYSGRFDNVDLDEVLSNRRLLVPYLNCVLDKGNCSPDGNELKSHIREALEENCEKCTDVQRKGGRRVISHIINHEPDYWNKLVAKYDPTHKYTTKYEEELRTLKA